MQRKIVSFLILFIFIISISLFAADTTKNTSTPKPTTTTQVTSKPALIDINSATKQQLMSLNGIGDAYSAKIIAGRPYTRKDQLKTKNIIPENVYNKIADKIIASQSK